MRIRMRRLRLGEHTFVWRATIGHVRGRRDCHRLIRVKVWRDGKTSRALRADLLSLASGTPWEPCATDGSYPTSGDVRALIEAGLRLGWDPGQRGGVFDLTSVANRDLQLDGFEISDFARTAEGVDPTAQVRAAKTSRGSAPAV